MSSYMVNNICLYCKADINLNNIARYLTNKEKLKRKYCNISCFRSDQKSRIYSKCNGCGRVFRRRKRGNKIQKSCSKKCRYIFERAGKWSIKHKKCLGCGTMEIKHRKNGYCLNCCDKDWSLKRYFGISFKEYLIKGGRQKWQCKICKKHIPFEEKRVAKNVLHVDHDHNNGKIRGLLCMNCNNGLGCFKDNPILLQEAKRYLKYYARS